MKLETKRFLKFKLLYLGQDRLKRLHNFRSTLLGTRPAENYEGKTTITSKGSKKTLIAQTCFKNVADDRRMEKKLKSGR